MSAKEKIRAEIERRINALPEDWRWTPVVYEEYQSFLSFLDTLPEQPASEEQAAILKLCATVRRYAAPAKDDDYCSRSELLRAVADAEKTAHGMK